MIWVVLSLTLALALITVSLTGSNRYCEAVREHCQTHFGSFFDRLTHYVPLSLRRTYPAVIALLLADIALVMYPGGQFDFDNAILATWAITAVILFIVGWWTDHKEITFNALWVNAGLWAGVSADIMFYDYQFDTTISLASVQLVVFCVSYTFFLYLLGG